jgi:DNA invertase Pin-like site-specific DNA recombinase
VKKGLYENMSEIKYIAGLYLRLSKEDERNGTSLNESASIENQRLMLTNYVKEKGWEIREEYIDDGYSGTNFERPAFLRMMRDVKEKRINLIVVKDLSRLGRNYLEVGRLTEDVLPGLGCRFIAMNDSVDSILGENDMMVYRNLFNEFYAKDTSKKIRAVRQVYMRQGKFLATFAPIGYKKDPADKHRLIIDEETAHIARRIFQMRCNGASFYSIATTFNEERVPSPKAIYYARNGRNNPLTENGLWNDSSVKVILRNEAYIGNTVQGKQGTISYKNKKQVRKPKNEWIRVENTHEPLISIEDWNMVRELDEKAFKPRIGSGCSQSIFVGLLKCADCGYNMRVLSRKDKRKDGSVHAALAFVCGNYARSGKSACTVHTISEKALTQILLEEIREHAKRTECNEKRVMEAVLKTKNRESANELATCKREFKNAEERVIKLGVMMATLYEDRTSGAVTDSVFSTLMQNYEREHKEKTEAIKTLRNKIEACENDNSDVSDWIKIIRKYTALESLNQKILLELIDKIEIFEAEKVGNQRVCKINIVYRFVGNINSTIPKSVP